MISLGMSRRAFLKWMGASGFALGTWYLASKSLGSIFLNAKPLGSPKEIPSVVSIAKGKDLYSMTKRALDMIGGIDSVIKPGDSVFIKPNYNALESASERRDIVSNGESTKPEVVLAVAEECLKAGASKVIIGEASHGISIESSVLASGIKYDNKWFLLRTLDGKSSLGEGVARLNKTYGNKVFLKNLNASTPYWVFVPSRTKLGKIAVSSFVTEADKIISIPVLKTHASNCVTISLKNFMGVTPTWLYGSPRRKLHDVGVEQCYLDVVNAIRPDLTVVDASIGLEGEGPELKGKRIDVADKLGYWLILSSRDLVAADSTATRIIGLDPEGVKHLRLAHSQGLGEMREDKIPLVGATIEDIQMKWIPPKVYPQK